MLESMNKIILEGVEGPLTSLNAAKANFLTTS
jgi:hypothetical protein